MKRCWKKAIAFVLALSLLASCVIVSAEETETNGNGITVIEEAVYDEAVSFSKSVVLVENGHWQDCVKDETTGEEVPVTDVTEDTNIVFIDGAGNKKVIKNKDANGGKIFDSVGLAYTRWDNYLCEYIYVFKGTDRAYISAEGDIFGETLEFYKDIKYINDDYLFVTKDGQTYELINKAGDVLYNIAGCDSAYFINGYFYIKTDESLVIIKETGMEVVKEYHNINYFYVLNDNYTYVSKEEKKIVLNSNAEEVLTDYVIEYCNAVEYSPSHLIIGAKSDGETEYFLMNMDSENVVMQFKSEPKVYSDGFILDSDGGIFTNIEGTVNVDLNSYTEQILGNGDGNYAGQVDYYYDNGILYHSLHRPEEDSSITYIISTKDGYQTTELIKVKGLITAIDKEKERYVLKSSSSKIYGLYNLSGELIKDFSDYSEYSYETSGHLFSFSESILTNAYITVNGMSNNVFIKTDGSIAGQYETVKDHGGFIFGGTGDGKLEVVNKKGAIVFSEIGLYEPKPSDSPSYAMSFIRNAYGLEKLDYFTIIRDGICSIYDSNGNKLDVGDSYSAIGPCGMIKGLCKVGENDYIGYEYENYATANGFCVTRKTDAEGNHKYGVIKFPESEISGTPENTPEPTNTPVPTPEPDYEKGDIDASGSIDAKDALMVLKQAAKISTLSEKQMVAADVDDSGAVNATDALYILKYAAKLIVRFVFTPEGNFAALKEYITEEGISETNGVYVIKKDYVAENDSAYEKEVDSFIYNSNSDTLEYRYDVSAKDDKGNYNYSYSINLGFKDSVIRIVYNEKSDEMNLDLDVQKTIDNSTIRFADDFSVDLVKNKYDVEYLDKKATADDIKQFEQDNVDYINAMMHMAILSMEDYLKTTAVMNLSDLGFEFKYSDEEFEKVFDILYGYDYNITQSIQELQNLITNKGTKDGDSILIHGVDDILENNQNVGQYYGCEVFLMYGNEVDALVFSGYTYFYDENVDCVLLTNILPMDNRQSYIYVNVFEPNSTGEYVSVAEYETQIDSKDVRFGGKYGFEAISQQDSSKKDIFVELANQSVYLVLMESSNTWHYDFGGYSDVELPDLGYINIY